MTILESDDHLCPAHGCEFPCRWCDLLASKLSKQVTHYADEATLERLTRYEHALERLCELTEGQAFHFAWGALHPDTPVQTGLAEK